MQTLNGQLNGIISTDLPSTATTALNNSASIQMNSNNSNTNTGLSTDTVSLEMTSASTNNLASNLAAQLNHSIYELQTHLINTSNMNNNINTNSINSSSNSNTSITSNNHQNGFKPLQHNNTNNNQDSKLSQLSNVNHNKNSISHINNEHNQNNGATSNGSSSNNNTNSGQNTSSNGAHHNNGNQHNSENNNHHHNYNNSNNNEDDGDGDDDEDDDNSSSSHTYSSKLKLTQRTFSSGQKDILRLIGQHLRYLGLDKTTELLVKESGCMLEHPTAASFCGLIMSGKWDEAEKSLNTLKSIMEDSNNNITNMKFLILEQKYLECLEDGKILEALKCLRDELAPLKFNTDRLHELSSFLMCSDQLNLKALSKWAGKSDMSRQYLMEKLQTFLPPNVMLPPRRLEALLNQAIDQQCDKCPYHNFKEKSSIDNWSFLRDHICSKDDFPTVTLQVINDHCDEVWYCKFSNNGKKLASGSKDGCLIIWDVDPETYNLTLNKTYEDHTCGVALISWSPDDRYVIICGTEESTELWIWDVENKVLKKRSHDDSLTSAAWLPDGQTFVTGGIKGHFYNCDMDGNIRETWEGIRVRCLQTLPDGQVLAADSLKRIRSYNFKDISDSNVLQEDFQIMSFTLNKAGNLALISVASQGIHLWDIKDKILVRRYQGVIQNNYMNYCTFGGADESYLASGSEDNRVYIWNIKKENAISVLEGHTRSVTCVTWNPEIPGMVVSASDDGTLRVWGPKSKQAVNLRNSNGLNVTNSSAGNTSDNGGSHSNNHSNNNNTSQQQPPPPPPPPPPSSSTSDSGRFTSTFFSSSTVTSGSSSMHHPPSYPTSAPPPPLPPNTSSQGSSSASNNRSDRSTPV